MLVPVTFVPSGRTAWVAPGTTVLEASRVVGMRIPAPCGGRGVCGSCAVRLLEGALEPPDQFESSGLQRAAAGVRLACRARVGEEPVSVRPLLAHPQAASSIQGEAGAPDMVAGVDLGTTSVSAVVLDARTGLEIGRATVPNRQSRFGADVLSRLSAALDGEGSELAALARESVVEALDLASADGSRRISSVVVAANTAMSVLFTGADPTGLATAPFRAPDPEDLTFPDSELLGIDSAGQVVVLAPLAAFVGGDVFAGLLASGALSAAGPAMLLDIGTNAEVVLATSSGLHVASAPAGPAFEGFGISCGGPAAPGAGVSVELIDGAPVVTSLGDGPAAWLTGSGLVSAVAMLRREGHLDVEGMLAATGPLESRFVVDEEGVLGLDLGTPGSPIVLSQLDIRSFQLAKAAVLTVCVTVLGSAGVEAARLTDIAVAGAFGGALRSAHLLELGIVPSATAAVVRHAGNTALQGAVSLAVDPRLLDGIAAAARERVVAVDVTRDPGFAKTLMRATRLEPYVG